MWREPGDLLPVSVTGLSPSQAWLQRPVNPEETGLGSASNLRNSGNMLHKLLDETFCGGDLSWLSRILSHWWEGLINSMLLCSRSQTRKHTPSMQLSVTALHCTGVKLLLRFRARHGARATSQPATSQPALCTIMIYLNRCHVYSLRLWPKVLQNNDEP